MTIELRPYKETVAPHIRKGDIDEVVANNAWVHLEVLGDNHAYLIIEDGLTRVHLNITHNGRSPLRITQQE